MVVLRTSLAAVGICLTLACIDPSVWEPRGVLRWVQWREISTSEVKSAEAILAVTNGGKVSLTSLDLALTLTTDKEVYHTQAHMTLDLPPGKLAYCTLEFTYRSVEEVASLSALRIDSCSFH